MPAADEPRYAIGFLFTKKFVTDGKKRNAHKRLAKTISKLVKGITPHRAQIRQISRVSRYADVGIQNIIFFIFSYFADCF